VSAPIVLKVRPLDGESFAPFGQVLAWRDGDHPRRNFSASLLSDRTDAKPNLRVQRTQPTLLPHTVAVVERHRHSSQMFAPLSGDPYFVTVFPADENGDPILASGIAFAARGDQAVNYNRDIWHLGFMAKDRPGTFLMLRWEDGTAGDEEFRPAATPIQLVD
jgi:ureidoglycolate lyase